MQAISIHIDMVFLKDVYTSVMTDAISQLQMVYVAEEDRILFRVNSTDKKEYRFWVTRRYAMLLAKVLGDHKQSDPDISSQVTQQAKAAVQSFKKEKARDDATFGEKFKGEGNEYPLGQDVQLAFKLSYNRKDNGTLHLTVQPKDGQGISIVINQDINTTLTQLLITAGRQGDWKLEEIEAEMRAQIELALQRAPDNVDANRMYSRICHNEGLLDEAIDGYLKVLQIKSDDIWSLNNLGLIRIEQERFDEALAPLAKAARLNTEVACIQNNLGVALERTGHYTAAAAAFEMALAADDSYEKADKSLDRVSGLTEPNGQPAVDLAALADGFSAFPTVVMSESGVMSEAVIDELEVAATLAPIAVTKDPQQDGPQDQ